MPFKTHFFDTTISVKLKRRESMRKIGSTLLSYFVLFSLLGPFQASAHEKANFSVQLNGKNFSFSHAPIISNNRLLVPLREFAETLGGTVHYDGYAQTIKVTKEANEILLTIQAKNAMVNGVSVALDAPVTLVHNVTYVPIRFISDYFGLDLGYDQKSRSVSLITNVSPHFKTAKASGLANHLENSTHYSGMGHDGHKEDNQPPRVYTINEISNTVSVIDPATNRFLMDISLGDEDIHRPLYNGFIDVHGAWLSPNGKSLIVTARGSSSVIKIDTESNKVVSYVSVGREPHAPMFTRDGKEVWVTIRGENYISVINPENMTIKEKVETINGPGMVYFTGDGEYAFVTSQKGDQLDIIDTATRKSLKKLTVGGKFSPFLTLSPDGKEMWVINKDTGKVTVIDTQKLEVKTIFAVGEKPNHVHFVSTDKGDFAYITSAGNNQVEVYSISDKKLVKQIDVGKTPHAVMPNTDMSRMYVDNENSNDVYVIDTATNQVIAIIPVGKKPIDLIYKP